MSRLISDGQTRFRILDCVAAMQEAATLEDAALAMVSAAIDLVDCDFGGYSEIDSYFGRSVMYSNIPQVITWTHHRIDVWHHYFPEHPVLRFRKANPGVSVVRLSDVTDMSDFYRSGLYLDLFREMGTRHQVVLHLGLDPSDGPAEAAFPLVLGIPLNRSGSDFTEDDLGRLAHLRRHARPVLRQKRAMLHLKLLDSADLTPELRRRLMGLGLTDRQSEVAFWMLKGKSNTDIATILDIGADTVRHHSMAIFRRLGSDGRLALQRAVVRSILEAG
jgi:DNA-binding CsgD family transcriptional regulator